MPNKFLDNVRRKWLGPGTLLVDAITAREAQEDIQRILRIVDRLRAEFSALCGPCSKCFNKKICSSKAALEYDGGAN
jgi:hypothetical protein